MKRLGMMVMACALLWNLFACAHTPTWQEQYDLGVRYLSEGNYEEAIIAFTAAIEIDPKRAEAYEKLADTYVALDDIESALEILRQGAEAIGDDTLFQDYINELTTEPEQSPGSPAGSSPGSTSALSPTELQVERRDEPDGRYILLYIDKAGNLLRQERYESDGTLAWIILHYYDEAGNLTRIEDYGPDGTLRQIDYCDAEGNLTGSETYN